MWIRSYILTTRTGRILCSCLRHQLGIAPEDMGTLIARALESNQSACVVEIGKQSFWVHSRKRVPWGILWRVQKCPCEVVAHGIEKMIQTYPWPACTTSEEGNVLTVNGAFARLLGMTSSGLQGQEFVNFFVHVPIFEKDFRTKIYLLKTAQEGTVAVTISHMVRTESCVTFFFFPTFLQEAGTGLGDVEFLGRIPLPAALLDENGGIQEANALCQEQMMISPVSPLAQWVGEKDRYAFAQLLRKLRKMRDGAGSISLYLRHQANQSIFIFLKYIPGHDEHAPGHFFSIFAMDDHHLLPMKGADPQKMQLLGQLASGIVHDFNNLLTGILGFCDLLLQRHQPEEMSFQDIQQIKQSAMRAARLIQKLLSFSKDVPATQTRICLKQCLQDLFPLINRMVGPKILVTIQDKGEDSYYIDGDLSQLEQIILNLVINGRDAMAKGGVLTVCLRRVVFNDAYPVIKGVLPPKTYVAMDVKDTGMGIDANHVDRIFDPFFSTKDPGQGTGLGLSNVLQIMDQVKGGITVDTVWGMGTTLSLHFPACQEPYAVQKGEVYTIPVPLNASQSIRILLVEDEDPVRLFAARALREKGHEVIEARDGVQATTFLEKGLSVHVVVTDVMMPGVDGPTLAASVRKLMPKTKILFVSGYPEESVRMNLSETMREIYFLPKPFALDDLVRKIQDMVHPAAA
jgi:two-component system cell cycle sensor histidine kinase/response regulator CckA